MSKRDKKLPRGVKRITYWVRPKAAATSPARTKELAAVGEAAPVRSAQVPTLEPAPPARSAAAPAAPPELDQVLVVEMTAPPSADTPKLFGESIPKVVITHVEYDGKVSRVESDEYIEIQNQGTAAVDLSWWRVSAGSAGQNFRFPAGTMIAPQQRFRIYTDEVHPETGGFSFGSKRAVWNNQGDMGLLFDANGAEVSRWAYGRKAAQPPKTGE